MEREMKDIMNGSISSHQQVVEVLAANFSIPQRFVGVNGNVELGKTLLDKGLLITGGVGTGKTHLLAQAIIGIADVKDLGSGMKIRFRTYGEVARMIRGSIGNGSYQQVYRQLATEDILIMDDLGTENNTEFMVEFLYNIINDRYNKMKPIGITTNLGSRDIINIYGERIASRLNHMCRVIKLNGGDRRK